MIKARMPLCGWVLAAAMVTTAAAQAETLQTLYTFAGPPDGSFPLGVTFDAEGNLYGATRDGGLTAGCPVNSAPNKSDGIYRVGCGTVFKLSPGSPWSETVLNSFKYDGVHGAYPGAPLVFHGGALFGTTEYGGYANQTVCSNGGCGTVFKVNPATKALTTLHTFTGGADSGGPYAGVAFNTTGSLYGTVEGGAGATNSKAFAYELTPPTTDKAWTFTLLGRFPGAYWQAPSTLVADKTGNLYGTTKNFDVGCIHGCGVIVKLAPPKYSPTQIYKFTGGADGGDPDSLTTHYRADGALILYGATRQGGGLANAGTVFAFEPGTRALTTLYAFAGGADGGGFGDVVYRNGALYGATLTGGRARLGAVFRLEPAKGQTVWKKTVLHAFTGGADGGYPLMGAFDAGGALYGVTAVGGNLVNCPADGAFPAGCGTAFKIAP